MYVREQNILFFYGNIIVMSVTVLCLLGIFHPEAKKEQKKMFPVSEKMISRKWICEKENF